MFAAAAAFPAFATAGSGCQLTRAPGKLPLGEPPPKVFSVVGEALTVTNIIMMSFIRKTIQHFYCIYMFRPC